MMNFIAICLHCLDMRDFHSNLRNTPFLDTLKKRCVYIPMGRGHGHHLLDSLNAEITGMWTARHSNSLLDEKGYHAPTKCWLSKTIIEYFKDAGYDIFTCIRPDSAWSTGTAAADADGMLSYWLKTEPERVKQFSLPQPMNPKEWLHNITQSKRFYAHIFLRETHRPWTQEKQLYGMMDWRTRFSYAFKKKFGLPCHWPYDAYHVRRAALDRPNAFSKLRRAGLRKADMFLKQIFEETKHLNDVVYLIYSNHGEVYDHFRYVQKYKTRMIGGQKMLEGTTHGPFPYEVLYANMQMWLIPECSPKVMRGIGRSIDITPTLLQLASIEHKDMDGENMLPYFKEGTLPMRDRYAETPEKDSGCISMVRKDGYKFLSSKCFDEHERAVFDLTTDPYEYINLIDTPQGENVFHWAIQTHQALKGNRGQTLGPRVGSEVRPS